ncbi:MAG: HAD hydrolase-like protein [Solobacterium sp.]|jgi:phosphoglycolate phosphatase|nr:HAD hydrolase-like protein [Solobacterium sp.]MCH4204961.1 HAD hydrolase-like protein [Solobacterium sp.]MCH4226353.1 HAD hydrolase-like protein [Solobacterium sp.]MCH4281754.1 HAD hydrolase-like protein [Solobacterium sp.]
MKTVIWDYNGTIIDDVHISVKIENQMLEERHLKAGYTLEQYRSLFCYPIIDYYYKIGYTFKEESYEEMAEEFNHLYDMHFHEAGLCLGFLDKIKESTAKGYRNVILSACEDNMLKEQCHALQIDRYFDDILGIDNNWAGSKVEMAKDWMDQADTDPKECIYFGDTTHDLETAHAIGVEKCILIAQGHQSMEILKETGAEVKSSLKEAELI